MYQLQVYVMLLRIESGTGVCAATRSIMFAMYFSARRPACDLVVMTTNLVAVITCHMPWNGVQLRSAPFIADNHQSTSVIRGRRIHTRGYDLVTRGFPESVSDTPVNSERKRTST